MQLLNLSLELLLNLPLELLHRLLELLHKLLALLPNKLHAQLLSRHLLIRTLHHALLLNRHLLRGQLVHEVQLNLHLRQQVPAQVVEAEVPQHLLLQELQDQEVTQEVGVLVEEQP